MSVWFWTTQHWIMHCCNVLFWFIFLFWKPLTSNVTTNNHMLMCTGAKWTVRRDDWWNQGCRIRVPLLSRRQENWFFLFGETARFIVFFFFSFANRRETYFLYISSMLVKARIGTQSNSCGGFCFHFIVGDPTICLVGLHRKCPVMHFLKPLECLLPNASAVCQIPWWLWK